MLVCLKYRKTLLLLTEQRTKALSVYLKYGIPAAVGFFGSGTYENLINGLLSIQSRCTVGVSWAFAEKYRSSGGQRWGMFSSVPQYGL